MSFIPRICMIPVLAGVLCLLPQSTSAAATVTVDLAKQGITIDGFGGFGSMTPWWNNGPYYTDQFLSLLIDSLGLTLLRTELNPTPDQETYWTRQIPYLRAIKAKADAAHEPYALYGTCWTAPARFKDNNNVVGGWVSDYAGYADYLIGFTQRVKTDIGYDLVAASPTNEPAICVGYNSMCADMTNQVGPLFVTMGQHFAAAKSPVPLSCNDMTWGPAGVGWVFDVVEKTPVADSAIKIVSIHYAGNTPLETRQGDALLRTVTQRRPWRHLWNTEFGGNFDSWDETLTDEYGTHPGGAWNLATNLFLHLMGDYNGIIYWQLCEPPHPQATGDHYSMFYQINGVPTPGPLFRVSQTVYRHVRPGAVKVGCTSSDTANVWGIAYQHKTLGAVSVVLYNRSNAVQTVTIAGAGLPTSMNIWQTSPTQNHALAGTVAPGGTVTLPVKSITTVCNAPITAIAGHAGVKSVQDVTAGAVGKVCDIAGRSCGSSAGSTKVQKIRITTCDGRMKASVVR